MRAQNVGGFYAFSDPTKIYVRSEASGDRYEEIVAHENFHRFHTQNTRLGILLILALNIAEEYGDCLPELTRTELMNFAALLARNMFGLQEGGAITSAFVRRWLSAPPGDAENIIGPYFESLDPAYTLIGMRHVSLEMSLLSLTADGNVSPLLLESFNHALTRFVLEASSLSEVNDWNFLNNSDLRAFLASARCSADHRLCFINDTLSSTPHLLSTFHDALRVRLRRVFCVPSFDSVHSLDAALVAYARKQLAAKRHTVDLLEFESLVISLCWQALELCFPGFADLKSDPDKALQDMLSWVGCLQHEIKKVIPTYDIGTLQVAETLDDKIDYQRSNIVSFE